MRCFRTIIILLLLVVQAHAWTPDDNTPLSDNIHPRLLFISDGYRSSYPAAVGETVGEMQTKINANYSTEFQAFIDAMDNCYSDSTSSKDRMYSSFDGMNFAFLYLLDPQNMGGYTATHTKAEYGAKAKEHALFVAQQLDAETVLDVDRWVDHRYNYSMSGDSGGVLNMSISVIYDWCTSLFDLADRQVLFDAAYSSYLLRASDFSGQLVNNKHTGIGQNGDYLALAMWGDDVGGGARDTNLQTMLDSFDTDWNQAIYGLTDVLQEGGSNWGEGSLYQFESVTHMSQMAFGASTALNHNYFTEMPYFNGQLKLMLYNTMPWRVNGNIGFSHYDDDAPEDGYFSIESFSEVFNYAIGTTDNSDLAKAGLWLRDTSGFIDNGTLGTNDMYIRRAYMLAHFFSGVKDVTEDTPLNLGLPLSDHIGGGQYVMRTGFADDTDTVISFWGQQYQYMHGGHNHTDYAHFFISKYGDIAIQRSVAKNFSGGNIAETKQNMFYNTMAVYKASEEGAIYSGLNFGAYRNNYSESAQLPTDSEYDVGGQNYVGTVTAEDLEGSNYDYINYDYSDAWDDAKVTYAVREFMYSRSNGGTDDEYVIVHDRINAVDSAYIKYFLLHSVTEPTVLNAANGVVTMSAEKYPNAGSDDGGRWTTGSADKIVLTNGLYSSHGKIINKTLYPLSYVINKVGGSGHEWEDMDGDLIYSGSYADNYKYYRGSYSMQVESTTNQNYDNFLNVMQIGDAGTLTSMSDTDAIDTTNMIGTHIKDATQNRVVLFNEAQSGNVSTDVDYTLTTTAATKHILTSMEASTNYTVTVNSSPTVIASNDSGTLVFDSSSGVTVVNVTAGGTEETTSSQALLGGNSQFVLGGNSQAILGGAVVVDICDIEQTNLIFHDNMDSVADPHTSETGQSISLAGSNALPTIVTGLCDDAVQFNNQNDQSLRLSDLTGIDRLEGNTTFWVKPDAWPVATLQTAWGSNTPRQKLTLNTDGTLTFRWNSNALVSFADIELVTDNFNKIQASWRITEDVSGSDDMTEVWIFLDDEQIGYRAFTNSYEYPLGSTWEIGQAETNDTNGMLGAIDNFTIYDSISIPEQNLTWTEDFEHGVVTWPSSNDASDGMSPPSYGMTATKITVETEEVNTGTYAGKFVLDRTDSYVHSMLTPRSYPYDWANKQDIGSTHVYEFSTFHPTEYVADNLSELFWQLHGRADATESVRNPMLGFYLVGDNIELRYKWDTRSIQPDNDYEGGATHWTDALERDVWVDWKIEIFLSYGNDGTTQVWRNGTLIVDYTGPNCYNDDDGPYLSFGVYKWDWTDPSDPPGDVSTRTMYMDDITVTREAY